MFTYSHTNTPLSQSERVYYLSYFIKFDAVKHLILLQKLEHYGIRGVLNNWFSPYLNDRYQTTQVGPHVSKKERCTSS